MIQGQRDRTRVHRCQQEIARLVLRQSTAKYIGSERENGELSLDVEVFDTRFRAVTATGKLSTRWDELKAEPQSQP